MMDCITRRLFFSHTEGDWLMKVACACTRCTKNRSVASFLLSFAWSTQFFYFFILHGRHYNKRNKT
ncbi:hypothetical protein BD289DRAFT_427848 [Coniella lustricola]|uniref:Uncharacterized protein n=1 Tax=Coniella lustricola TaxID=2025994 RepID=A0A2T3AEQ7_9PEZI|nr:hypothetical protein BD289DRAFT_427848 [Coniella lustricola]